MRREHGLFLMHIIGTAGHVDHGKSSLVVALTGHNPDRLIEEQDRGMTLDLGFAPLRFPDGVDAGIIDVPGHERFLHNMLAGALGMELLLLVIAAPDGPKPQTFEHLHILNFLNVSRAIIVLTKIDLVKTEDRRVAAQLAREACEGTVAADAPLIAVSVVTGEGIAELKAAIHDALAALPPRRNKAPAFLPVDRVFAMPGHGTIVTGTLVQGTLSVGDTLALQPSGLVARVKSLQIFGAKVQTATGGSRVAVNIPGVNVDQIARGEALVAAREFVPTRELNVEFSAVLSALPILRKRMPVRVHIGSAEILGQLRFADAVPASAHPARASITLWHPAVFYPGMRIIVRRMSPKDLLGGATTLAAGSPTGAAKANVAIDLEGAPESAAELAQALEASGLASLGAAQLAARANVTISIAEKALAWLIEHGLVIALSRPLEYVSRSTSDAALERTTLFLRKHHDEAPWRLGAHTADIAKAISVPEALALRLLNIWQEDGRLASRARSWHLPDFSPSLSKEQSIFFDKILANSPEIPYLPHSFDALLAAAAKHSKVMTEAMESLLAAGSLVRIGDDVYRRSQIESAQRAIQTLMDSQGQATMAQVRDVLGTSRKHALPLMEHFDSVGFTMRDGDLRRLRHQSRGM